MSTFPGVMEEIPFVSIDCFQGKNLNSKAFFLSHFHSDHMRGLRSKELHSILENQDSVYLHCSEITALFLSHNHLSKLSQKIRVLTIGKPFILTIEGLDECLTVTPLPAGHCPGSVMFLFQYLSKYVLYTGDFRMTRKDICAMRPLRAASGDFLTIHSLYLDTTFSEHAYSFLPDREQSMEELINLCKVWLNYGKSHIIDIRTPASIGVEYVFIKLFEVFHQPVHVSDSMYEKYAKIPDLAPAITKNRKSQFHACIPGQYPNGRSLFHKTHFDLEACTIHSVKLCALHARDLRQGQSIVSYHKNQDLYKIAYSSHSSHCELLDILDILKPAKIFPCVVSSDFTSNEVVQHLLPQKYAKSESSDTDDCSSFTQFSLSEEAASSNPKEDSCESLKAVDKAALFPVSKYNVEESSDEGDLLEEESDSDELPPFRWDCFFDATKILGLKKEESASRKRQRLK